MKTAWQALSGPWRAWYTHPRRVDRYFPDRAAFRAEVRRLLKALAAHHRPTAAHSVRVGRLAARVGEAMGLDRGRRGQLALAGRLHDLGKLYVDRDLLKRNAPAREHVLLGERAVQHVTPCPAVHEAVRWHHERHDGLGYPDGLAGEQIPLFARILAVAEAYDEALMTAPLGRGEALDRLRQDAGRRFHPDVVGCFIEAVRRTPLRRTRRRAVEPR